jgi:poly(3-hydroxybutyrate) depolymerase
MRMIGLFLSSMFVASALVVFACDMAVGHYQEGADTDGFDIRTDGDTDTDTHADADTDIATDADTGDSTDGASDIDQDTGTDAVKSTGCGKTPTLKNKSTITIQSGGMSRQYILWYPDDYDNTRPHRLVLAYHWWSGSAQQVVDCHSERIDCYTTQSPFYGLWEISDGSTIFVAPDGIDAGWANSGGRDLTFTDDILEQVENDLCVDTTRIFANGFSYGGGMSYAIACARADVFRAVAVYAGAELSGCEGGNTPIAYYASHGLDDGTCTPAMGRALRDHFVRVNGCTPQDPPEPADRSGEHICTTYEGCLEGHPVRWCVFDGSNGHDPSPKDPGESTTWNPQEVWSFFTQF